ncbi:MAG: glycosyltransferase family 39 protein [Candidatus Dormibacteraeota bacterium]|nr:glycosyltransferase family 39 protein [Candidatus Dormibacteraeota bacterium]
MIGHPLSGPVAGGSGGLAGSRDTPEGTSARRRESLQLTAVLVAAFALRLGLGLLQPPEADEATLGYAALRIAHGHLILMESNAHYLGAAGAYLAAPFVSLLGTSTLALRLPMSLVGAGYVALTYALGRAVFSNHRGGLRAAAVAAVFPLFAVLFPVRALWAYGEVLPLETLLLLLTVRIGWRGAGSRADWLTLGLVTGLGLWVTPLLVVVLAPCGLALLLRAGVLGWGQVGRGAVLGAAGALLGYTPWLVYNLLHRGASLHGLAGDRVGRLTAARQVLNAAIPIFSGAVRTCGAPQTVPSALAVLGVGGLLLAALATSREPLGRLLHGQLAAAEPLHLVLLVAPVSLASVTLSGFNGVSCEPRYLLPLALPLVLAAAAVLGRWRLSATTLLAAWVVVESITVARTPQVGAATSTGAPVPVDVGRFAAALEARHLPSVYADYWLERPLLYAGGGRLLMGEYNGFVGFPGVQAAADAQAHPSWLFVQGDPTAQTFEAACRRRGVGFQRSEFGGLVLYASLTSALRPSDLGLRVDQSRYPLGPAAEDSAGPDR